MTQEKKENILIKLTYSAFFVWALFTFVSFSVSALGHILLVVPGLYFTYDHFKNRDGFKIPMSSWMLIGLVVVGIISVLLNLDTIERPIKNIFKLKYFLITFIGTVACYYATLKYIDQKRTRLLLNIFMFTTALASLVGIIALYTGFNYLRFKDACHTTRACGMFGMYMSYAYAIQFVVILLGGLIVYKNRLKNFFNSKLLYISFAINLLGLILSYTRGAWIGVVVATPFIFYFKSKKAVLLSIAILTLLVASSFGFSQKVRDTFFSNSRITSNNTRISIYKTAVAAFKEKPFFGIGYRNFEPSVAKLKEKYKIEYPGFVGHGHSNFFEHLASTGIFGVIFLLLFHIFWFIEAAKSAGPISSIMMGIISALFVSGQFQYTIGDGEVLFVILAFYMLFSSTRKSAR
jgi:O-antigen ligase